MPVELDKRYDLIVIGGNLSAYIAAALAARRGLEVLLVENAEAEYSYESQGYRFDFVPQYSAGFYPEKLFDRIFQELGLSIGEQFDIRKIGATYQVISPSFRVNISDNFPVFRREIEREFPDLSGKILNFYRALKNYYEIIDTLLEKDILMPPSTFREKRAYSKILHSPGFAGLTKFKTLDDFLKHFELAGTGFEVFVKAQIHLFSYTYSPNPGFIQTVRILGNMMKRTCYIDGGYQKLIDLLKKKLLASGGEIKSGSAIEELIYNHKKLAGIRLSSFEGIVYSKYILSSLEVNEFLELMGNRIQKSYHRKARSLLKEYGLFTVNIAVNAAVIPVGMKDRFVYIVNDKKPLIRENLILGLISHEKDNLKAPPGKRLITTSCIVPFLFLARRDSELIRIRDRMIFNLKKIIPFFEEHVVTIHPSESRYFKHLNSIDTPVETPEVRPVFLYHRPGKTFLGISAVPNRTQENNLLFTGREVLPDIGFEGEMHSCYKVVSHVDREVRRGEK